LLFYVFVGVGVVLCCGCGFFRVDHAGYLVRGVVVGGGYFIGFGPIQYWVVLFV